MRSIAWMLGLVVFGCVPTETTETSLVGPLACRSARLEAAAVEGSERLDLEAVVEWSGGNISDDWIFEVVESAEPCPERSCSEDAFRAASTVIESKAPWAEGQAEGTARSAFRARPGHGYRVALQRQRPSALGGTYTETLCEASLRIPYTQPVPQESLPGNVYASRGDTFELPVFAGLQGSFLEVIHMTWLPHLVVDAAQGDQLQLSVAWPDVSDPDHAAQKPCTSTTPLVASFDNPHFVTEPTMLEVVGGMGTVRIHDVVIRGSFAEDAQYIGDLAFEGLFDMRDLAPELRASVQTMCDDLVEAEAFWVTFGVQDPPTCEACPDGELACLWLEMDTVKGTLDDLVVTPGQDACGVEGDLARWDYEHEMVHSAEHGGTSVRGIDWDGRVVWTADFGSPIDALQYEFGHPDLPLLALSGTDVGNRMFWRLDRQTGTVDGPWNELQVAPSTAGGDILWMDDAGAYGGVEGPPEWAGLSCAVVSLGLGGAPLSLVLLPLLGVLGRARGRRAGVRTSCSRGT